MDSRAKFDFCNIAIFLLGIFIEEKNMYEKVKKHKSSMLGVVSVTAMLLVAWVGSQFNGMVSVQKMQYGNYIVF